MNYEITEETLEEFGIAYDLQFRWIMHSNVFVFKYENYEIHVMLDSECIMVVHERQLISFTLEEWDDMLDFIDFQF